MNNKINIAPSILIENAAQQYLTFTEKLMQEQKLNIDLIEFALEKALLFVKNQKLQIYSSALYELSTKQEDKTITNQAEQFMDGLTKKEEN